MLIKNLPHFIASITLLTFCLVANAQTYKPPVFTDADRLKKIEATYTIIDQIYKDYAEKNHWPGMVYGIVVDGKLVHTSSVGYTDIANKIPADSKSDFRIASMTKSLTAMAILKLRDEGKLKLDDPIYLYIPEAEGMKPLTKDATPITIKNLLTHSAGFPEDNPWGDRQLADSDDELIAMYKKGVAFSNDPGLGYEYSNLGFATLGYIIKKVSGKTYEEYITENILKPLGMTHTYWEYDKVPADKLAHGYRWLDNNWAEQPLLHDGSYGAMGGLITTIEDFTKYMAVHLDAWPPRDDAETGPVKRSSVREMQYPWDFNSLLRMQKILPVSLAPQSALTAMDWDGREIAMAMFILDIPAVCPALAAIGAYCPNMESALLVLLTLLMPGPVLPTAMLWIPCLSFRG
ncbi:MAG: serine hydrolase [Mucilaginibacter sp.]|nr:serine hydrolase [Mucilaginibacter sp.]